MKQKSKLQHEQKQESQSLQQQDQNVANEKKQFSSAEELLRFEAEKITVPPGIAERLNQSIAAEPTPAKSWWQKIFSK